MYKFIKGITGFTIYQVGAWFVALKVFWKYRNNNVSWFAHETYFKGENAIAKRDEYVNKVYNIQKSYETTNN